jgi:hypothetical protein
VRIFLRSAQSAGLSGRALVAQFKEVGITLPQKDEAYFDLGMYSWVPLTISQIKDAANRLANDLESAKKTDES